MSRVPGSGINEVVRAVWTPSALGCALGVSKRSS